ncbi:DMT family transporter [Streptomyces sp. NBC_01187]|uniref:DMT family transporter n=1 Tax=Streptomyces sp. NBC_01187 TaxID=2903766 RepID=UPI00386BD3D9|nr:DMT family transporter [Streptomyces sp. NBC_01187]
MPSKKGVHSPYFSLSVTMVLWGSAFSSSKSVVDHVPHSVAALLRFGGAALALLVAVAILGGGGGPGGRGGTRPKISPRVGGRAALAGVLGVFAYNSFFFWGLSLAPSLDAGILIPVMSPVLTSLLLLVTGRERASGMRVAGLGLGLAGAVLFFLGAGGSTHGDPSRLAGDALFLLSAVCWAAYTLAGPRVLAGIDPLRATTYATCAGALLLGVMAAPDIPRVEWGELPPGVWLNAVYLALGAAAVANLLYYRGVGAVGPASASLMMFTVPVVNTACGTLFLGETFGPVQAAGALVLLAGAVLAALQGRLSRRTAAARPLPGQGHLAGEREGTAQQ